MSYDWLVIATIAIFAIEVIAMVVIGGYAGQLSLAQAGIMGVGAYVFAIAANAKWPLIAAITAGIAAAVAFGLIAAAPALRLRTDYFAIASLGLGEVAVVLETNLNITGGVYGLSVPSFLGSNQELAIVAIIVMAAVLAFTWLLCRSLVGSVLLAILAVGQAARGVGINVTRVKVLVFMYTSMLAGIGGVLYTQLAGYIAPSEFDFPATIMILIPYMISGRRNLIAAVVVTALIQLLQQYLATTPAVSGLLLGGILLIGLAVQGLAVQGHFAQIRRLLRLPSRLRRGVGGA